MNRNPGINLDEIRKMYVEEGLSSHTIAKRIGASSAGVLMALERAGVPRRSISEAKAGECRLDIEWSKVATQYTSGDSLEKLAKEHDCAVVTVRDNLLALGISMRSRGRSGIRGPRAHKFDVQEAIRLSMAGKPVAEISESFNVPPEVIGYHMRKAGYVAREKKPRTPKRMKGLTPTKRKVLQALGYEKCLICGETRVFDLAHIASRKTGHDLIPENAMLLCPTHHRLYDKNLLSDDEVKKIAPTVLSAAVSGFENVNYPVQRLRLL